MAPATLRRNPKTARKLYFHLGFEVQQHHQRDIAVAGLPGRRNPGGPGRVIVFGCRRRLTIEFERLGIAQENPQTLLGLGRGIVQRLGACRMRARTSSPCNSAPSCNKTAAPGSRTSRYCASPSENSTASKWPVGSDSPMMPILLPVLVRRSIRETHRRGDLAGGRAGLHRAGKLGPGLDAQPLQRGRVVIERMARTGKIRPHRTRACSRSAGSHGST